MQRKNRSGLVLVLLLAMMTLSGCKIDFQKLWQKTQPSEPPLFHVEMHFANGDVVVGYVKSMGIEDDGIIYNGGSSLSYIYNEQGTIVGSLNYARLEYMQLVQ
ncbi:MAG TPA: hypothetical protein PLC88_05985 [Syntrophomonas sp.]|nr:hypothetical protein [Syntrophomonas sp.]HRW12292.1 hypothetical protein [Syntrophomonas sp.]